MRKWSFGVAFIAVVLTILSVYIVRSFATNDDTLAVYIKENGIVHAINAGLIHTGDPKYIFPLVIYTPSDEKKVDCSDIETITGGKGVAYAVEKSTLPLKFSEDFFNSSATNYEANVCTISMQSKNRYSYVQELKIFFKDESILRVSKMNILFGKAPLLAKKDTPFQREISNQFPDEVSYVINNGDKTPFHYFNLNNRKIVSKGGSPFTVKQIYYIKRYFYKGERLMLSERDGATIEETVVTISPEQTKENYINVMDVHVQLEENNVEGYMTYSRTITPPRLTEEMISEYKENLLVVQK
ncbi:MAG: hypothetical protein ACRCWQ_03825 [Bacilli bacterium]